MPATVPFVSVSFAAGQTEEVAYRDGAFVAPYLGSTRVGDTFALKRAGGWSGAPTVHVEEAAPAPAVSPPAALTPTLYGPAAQWSLQTVGSNCYADRSGNGRHLTGGAFTTIPDLIPSGSAVTLATLTSVIAALVFPSGEFTLTCRVWWLNKATSQVVCDIGDLGQATNYLLGAGPAGEVVFIGANIGGAMFTSSLMLPAQRWCFLSARRTTGGVVTVGIDGAYQDSPVMPLPTGIQGRVIVGSVEGENGSWKGALADMSLWARRLTDAELTGLRAVAMGEVAL
jgi:hypothetical protein